MEHPVWSKFLAALDNRGLRFDQVAAAGNRTSVISACGFSDALEVALLETMWDSRVGGASGNRSGGAVAASGPLPRGQSNGSHLTTSIEVIAQQYPPEQIGTAPEEVQDAAISAELIAVLVGHSGAFFQLKENPTRVEATPLVPLNMRAAVDPILRVAEAFIALSRVEGNEVHGPSLVLMALAEVLNEITANFAHNISELAKSCAQRSLPLLLVCAEARRIGHHLLRLAPIAAALQSTQSGEHEGGPLMVGGALLNFLFQQHVKHSGSQEDDQLYAVLLRRAARPYLRTLRQWVQEGVLHDPYEEFFVSEQQQQKHSGSGGRKSGLNTSVAAFRDLLAPNAVLLGQAGTTSSSSSSIVPEVFQFDRRFLLNKSKIPQFFLSQGRVAKMIFYCGKYCCLLREHNGTLPDFSGLAAAEEEAWLWTSSDALQRVVEECYHRSCASVIQLLRSPEVDLHGHLESLKRFFLHGRGDWLLDFLDTADELLQKSHVHVKVNSLRVLLQSAIGKACKSDPYHTLISCSFAETTFSQYTEMSLRSATGMTGDATGGGPRGTGRMSTMHVESRRCIELLQLEADLQWPLTLLLDPVTLKHMNNIFRLLLWVKVCERSVNRWWSRNQHAFRRDTRIFAIHQQMIQFLRQFQFYAAHFVIEPNWSKCMGRLTSADDVISMSHALQDFFENLEHSLILSNFSRFRSFSRLLELMNRFGEIGKAAPTRASQLDDATSEALRQMEESFLKNLQELAAPKGEDYPLLVPMLTWIDFSRYYDRKQVYRVQAHGALGNGPGASGEAQSAGYSAGMSQKGSTPADGASVFAAARSAAIQSQRERERS